MKKTPEGRRKLRLDLTSSQMGMLLGLRLRAEADATPKMKADLEELFSQVKYIEPTEAQAESSQRDAVLKELRAKVDAQVRVMDTNATRFENDDVITDKRMAGLFRAKQSAYDYVLSEIDRLASASGDKAEAKA
jgi:hypothetical protein